MATVKWGRDVYAEQRLKDFGVKWQEADVKYEQIDLADSERNHARLLKPIDLDLIAEYRQARLAGDEFPKPVLLKRPGKGYLVLSGNHRVRAAEGETIPAYIVTTDDKGLVDIIPRVLNRGHGDRQGREEALEHAVYVARKYNHKPAEVAEMFNVSVANLQLKLRARAVMDTLMKRGVPADRLGETTLNRLGSIKNDSIQLELARLLAVARLKQVDAVAVTDEVRGQKTEAEQLAVVNKYRTRLGDPEEQAQIRHSRPLRSEFLRALTTLERVVNGKNTLAKVQITSKAEQEEISGRCQELARRLHELGGHASGHGVRSRRRAG